MMRVISSRDFALLWWGGLVSMLGSWAMTVALPVYVYQTTGSTLATSLTFIAGVVPRILLGPFAGVLVDRVDRKHVMVVCNLLLAAAEIPLLFVVHGGPLWLVYVLAAIQSCVGQFFDPAESALLPTLVEREDLAPANSLNALNNNLARLMGPALGGLTAGVFGLQGVVLLDIATYLVSALLISQVATRTVPSRGDDQQSRAGGVRSWVSEWRDGLAAIRENRTVTVVLFLMALTAIGEGAFGVLFVPFVSTAFGGGSAEVGWVLSAQAVGGIAGGVLIAWAGSRVPVTLLFSCGLLFLGLIDLAIINYPLVWPTIVPALVLMALVGVPAAAAGAAYNTLVQTSVEDRLLGRVYGTFGTLLSLTMLLGMAAAGSLGDLVGVIPVINIQGVVYTAAGLLALFLIRPMMLKPPDHEPPALSDPARQ